MSLPDIKMLFIKCCCSEEGLSITEEDGLFEISFWNKGFYDKTKLSLKQKFVWIFQIIFKKVPYNDMVILNKDEAKKLKDFLEESI